MNMFRHHLQTFSLDHSSSVFKCLCKVLSCECYWIERRVVKWRHSQSYFWNNTISEFKNESLCLHALVSLFLLFCSLPVRWELKRFVFGLFWWLPRSECWWRRAWWRWGMLGDGGRCVIKAGVWTAAEWCVACWDSLTQHNPTWTLTSRYQIYTVFLTH